MLRLGLQTTLSHRTVPHLPASVHAAAVLGRRSLGLVTTTPLPHLRRLGGSLRPHQAFNPPTGVIVPATLVVGTRTFHTTRRNNALPMLPFLAGVLKVCRHPPFTSQYVVANRQPNNMPGVDCS